jgi:hypothetical protein
VHDGDSHRQGQLRAPNGVLRAEYRVFHTPTATPRNSTMAGATPYHLQTCPLSLFLPGLGLSVALCGVGPQPTREGKCDLSGALLPPAPGPAPATRSIPVIRPGAPRFLVSSCSTETRKCCCSPITLPGRTSRSHPIVSRAVHPVFGQAIGPFAASRTPRKSRIMDRGGTEQSGNSPPPHRTDRTRRVPHPVLIGRAASPPPY